MAPLLSRVSFSRGFGRRIGGSSTISFVGQSVLNGGGTFSYPAGTTTGDLAIVVCHNQAASTAAPSGYTSVFSTAGDSFGYGKNVSYRIIQAGDTSVNIAAGGSGYDQTIVVLRGRTSVSATYTWTTTSIGGGATQNFSVADTGSLVVIASDRGATGYPTISGQTFNATGSGTATYFYQSNAVLLSYTSGSTVSVKDFSDTYGTSALLLVAK